MSRGRLVRLTFTTPLAELRIDPPASIPPAVFEDRRRRIGNRLAFHHFDRAPAIEDFG